jgi:hypothetical protein
MTHIPTQIRRWKILMVLTLVLMAATEVLMFLRFSPLHGVMFFTQTVLLVTQYSSLEMLKECKG